MRARRKDPWTGWGSLLTALAIVAFMWGVERWRRDAAERAGGTETARITALARCLLGPDGATLLHSPDAARTRLRALAMATPSSASVTWFDRCVPLARSLAAHAVEVDNTRSFTAAESRVAESTRVLADAMERVGLVWRIRTGDPETDMDLIADRLAQVAGEIQLASDRNARADIGSPTAPDAPSYPRGTVIRTDGLEPAPVGTPDRFLVGAPLPAVAVAVREGDAYHLETLPNAPSFAWHLRGDGLVRIDALLARSDDGLAPLEFLRLDGAVRHARVTSIANIVEGSHVALDAAVAGPVLWFAEWTPLEGAVLARFAETGAPTAVTLSPPAADANTRNASHSRELDEHVAVEPLGNGAVVAFTLGSERHDAHLVLATTRADSERAPVLPLADHPLGGAAPELAFCSDARGALRLVAAGTNGWSVFAVESNGIRELHHVEPPAGYAFDRHIVVRCGDDSMIVYAREHAAGSPLLYCPSGETSCERLDPPVMESVASLPVYTTRLGNGQRLEHAEWPLAVVDADGTLVAARAAGTVVSIVRREAGQHEWTDDRVVFDAAAQTHGVLVQGLGAYAHGRDVLVAASAADGLHVFASHDSGRTWE